MPLVSLEQAVEPLVPILPDVLRHAYVAKQNCKKPADNLTQDESASIMIYTMEWDPPEECLYVTLNNTLRAKDRQKKLQPWYLYLRLFLNALFRLPLLSITAYRGVKLNLGHRYIEGETIVWWGFSSCTTSISVLESDLFLGKTGTRTMFTLHCKSARDISKHSWNSIEDEVLLMAATQFKVTGSLNQGNLHIIQLEETMPPFSLLQPVPIVGALPIHLNPSESMCSSVVYIPGSSLNEEDLQSLVNVCLSNDNERVDMHGGRRAAFQYLSQLKSFGMDLSSYIDSKTWGKLIKKIKKLQYVDYYKQDFDENRDDTFEKYWELNSESRRIHSKAKKNRKYTTEHFQPEQLKVYFNKKQIENIPYSEATFESSRFVDSDARDNMRKYPISERKNKGQIKTIKGRIEQAVFRVPPGKQIIILDFADDRMPGGLFLYGASTQEETICYNSNTYRALLDFKYQRFDGGFMIPEFGCLYIKNVKFYQPVNPNVNKNVDIIAAACYDLTEVHGLHIKSKEDKDLESCTKKKFETIIASAQANSNDNGENTYLILGPIGCGAFQNDIKTITELWENVLSSPLNEYSKTKQHHAFEEIWFLSGKDDKLEIFEEIFDLHPKERLHAI
ncbi:unnamed protein product [Rotaria magnacalcarata]|nr:unnamed protein product [Rotaria magnacalcarata]